MTSAADETRPMRKNHGNPLIMIIMVLTFCLSVSSAFAQRQTAEVTWVLNQDNHTLTISGEGDMPDYEWEGAPWYAYRSLIHTVIIEPGITSIGNCAFQSCGVMTAISIPESVTTIGNFAFYYCFGLHEITIPENVTTIGEAAFYGCIALTSVAFPSGVTRIEAMTFFSCYGLTENPITNNITYIGESAFYDCPGLHEISIPASVTEIGDNVFYCCINLTAINVASDNMYYASENGVLFNKNKSTLICYPAGKQETTYIIPGSVTTIEFRAFAMCYALLEMTIPNSVATIEHQTFVECTHLTSVTFPSSVTEMEDMILY
jgi:hypothetical protein